MTNSPRHIFTLLTAACITGCFFLLSCENDDKKIDDWTRKITLHETADNIESYLSQDGRMKARLTAPLMVRSTTDSVYVEFPASLHCDFYDSTGKVETRLDALYGKYFENMNKVYLRDSVLVISEKGDTLRSPDLWWDQNLKLFYTDKYAIYHGKNMNVTGGKGLEATQDLKSVSFKEASGNVKVEDNGGLPAN